MKLAYEHIIMMVFELRGSFLRIQCFLGTSLLQINEGRYFVSVFNQGQLELRAYM